jgi:hypothetical protein
MGYAVAIADLARERAGRAPDRRTISKVLEAIFRAQLPNGLWPKAASIFHYAQRGSVYPFAFETLTAIIRMCIRVSRAERDGGSEFFAPWIGPLLKTLAWAETNELNAPVTRTRGWRSNHVPRGDVPHAWATAMVLSFVNGLHGLLRQIARAQTLLSFRARTPTSLQRPIDAATWIALDEARTRIAGSGETFDVKDLIFNRLLRPHLENAATKPWSAILFGPPGTSKTKIARAIAQALGWPFVSVGTSDLLALGADKMAHQARLLFQEFGRLYEVVVLIDEVEEFVRDREQAESSHESRLLTTAMLTLIQGLRESEAVLLLLATNYIEVFDQAIMRPGRFDFILYIPPPSTKAKTERLDAELRQAGISLTTEVGQALARRSDVVDRFTFHDWQGFVRLVVDTVRDRHLTALDSDTVMNLLDRAARSTTITEQEWDVWKQRTSQING